MEQRANPSRSAVLTAGTRVEVRTRYQGSWTDGFEIFRTTDAGYVLRRESDGYVLPIVFIGDDVRRPS